MKIVRLFPLCLLFLLTVTLVSAQTILTGKIIDTSTDLPLTDVNVYFKNKSVGTTSNVNGEFKLNVPSSLTSKDTLLFSLLGYKTEQYSYPNLKAINFIVKLKKQTQVLEEVNIISEKDKQNKLQYQQLPSIKQGIHSFASTIVDDKIYVFGGDASFVKNSGKKAFLKIGGVIGDSDFREFIRRYEYNGPWTIHSDQLHVYDILSKTWFTSKLKFRKRAYHDVLYHNNKLSVIGGKRMGKKNEYLDDKIEILDVDNQTISIDDTNPHQAVNSAMVTYKDKFIIMGGSTKLNRNGKKTYSNTMHFYDTETGFWYELGKMTEAKETQGVGIGDTIYLVGGYQDRALRTIEAYDLNTGQWSDEGKLFYGIEKPALTSHKNIIYIFDYGKLFTYDTKEKVMHQYSIDLFLKAAQLYYHKNKLYIFGGFTKTSYSEAPSPKLFSIDLKEFDITRIKKTKRF